MATLNDSLDNLRQHLESLSESSEVFERISSAVENITAQISSFPTSKIEEIKSLIDDLSNSIENIGNNGLQEVLDKLDKLEDILSKTETHTEHIKDNVSETVSETEKLLTTQKKVEESHKKTESSSKKTLDSTRSRKSETEGEAKALITVKDIMNQIERAASAVWENWKGLDEFASKHGRTLGLDQAGIRHYRRELFTTYAELSQKFGMTNKELVLLQQGYTKATGKSRLLTKQATSDLAANSKIIGQENVDAIAEAMDNLGGSAMGAAGAMANISQRARAQGLDAVKAAKGMAEAMKMSQKYTFREGVNGMSKMVAKAQSLKVSMQSIESAAEKFSTIEGAITTSAQLQVLGGQLQNAFSNPMEMMGLALTDMGEFQDRLLKGFQSVSYFNEQTGRMDMSQLDKMRLQAAAKAAGMSYEDAFNAATQQGLQDRIEKSLGSKASQLQGDSLAWIKNNAQYNTDTRQFEVHWQDDEGNMHQEAIENLSDESVKILKKRATREDAMADDVKTIRKLLDKEHEYAIDTKSWNETLSGMNQAMKNWGSWSIDKIIPKRLMIWLSSLGVGGLTGYAALRGLGAAGRFGWGYGKNTLGNFGVGEAISRFRHPNKKLASGREIKWNKEKGGYGYEYQRQGKTIWRRATPEQLSKATSTSRLSKLGRSTSNATSKVSQKLGKIKPKGKAGSLLKWGAVIAGTAMATSAMASNNNGQGTQSNIVESDGTILGELQKQTSLLEIISKSSENNAYGKHSALYGSESIEEETPSVLGATVGATKDLAMDYAKFYATDKLAKFATRKLTGEAIGVMNPWGYASMGADLANMGGQALGLWEEGDLADRGLNVMGKATEYAGFGKVGGAIIGGILGSIIPGAGTAAGAALGSQIGQLGGMAVGAIKGVLENNATAMGEKSKEMLEQGGFWNTIGGGLLKAGAWIGGYEDPEKLAQQQDAANGALDQMLFERTKIGVTSIADPQIMQKGALATIQIHDLLVNRWNKEDDIDFSADKIKGWRKDIAEGDMTAEDIMKKFGAKNEVGHMATGGIVGESEKPLPGETVDTALAKVAPGEMVINQAQQGKLWSWINDKGGDVVSKPVAGVASIIKKGLSGGLGLLKNGIGENAGAQNISVNINGTIKLVGDGNVGKIDARELAKNKEFMDMIYRHVTSQMDRKGQLGIGTNKNSSLATRGYGIESGVAT